MIRKTLRALLVALASILPVPALASFHLVKIVEVFPGTAAVPTAQYVMLQMYFPGQSFVLGHSVEVFDASGTSLGTFTFSHNLSNSANLATMLIATSDAETLFGVTADLTMNAVIDAGGGAVCWDVVDCVAWGSFSASSPLPVPPGTPFNAPDGLLFDMAMHRNLSSGGTVTNFVFAAPAPKNNAGQVGTVPPTPSVTATPTPLPIAPLCVGDCNGGHDVTVDEILIMVNIALGSAPISACEPGDANQDGDITVTEIIAAVNFALTACPGG
jgi:hypothetical protein